MMKRILSAAFLVLFSAALLYSSEGDDIFRQGLTHFEDGDYTQAYRTFTRLVEEEPFYYYRANAVFWQGKSQYMLGDYVRAAELLGQYLINWPDNGYYEEAVYLMAKNRYQQEQYQEALDGFIKFTQDYSGSRFMVHALYWSAESLYQLGHIPEARQIYDRIIRDYPNSSRLEAARYRYAIIEIKEREEKLLELLKWSHEEFLKSGQENSQTRAVYEEALRAYQEKIALMADREKETYQLLKLVRLKARALELKEFYLDEREAR